MFTACRDINMTGGTVVHAHHAVLAQQLSPRDKLLQHVAVNAMHDSDELETQGICLERTRELVLKLLEDYLAATTLESPNFLWLNGAAGAGKSAIARTIALSASEAGTLLASFFFYNSDNTRNTINPLIPTLAVQICRRFPKAWRYVEEAIENDPLVFSKSTAAQAAALIIRPLKQALGTTSCADSPPLSILVDGLDECTDSQRQTHIIDVLLDVIAKLHAATGLRLKLVVFSRPERWIRNRISRCEAAGEVLVVTLEGELNPRSDIKLYYDAHFARIRETHPMGPVLDPDWPAPAQMETLIDITDKHFAFAHMMRIFVANPDEDPTVQLEIVLGITPPTSESPHTHIDQLYAAIFSRVPKRVLAQALRVIGAILVPSMYAIQPNPPLLELVFSLKKGEIQQIFFHLESLFDLGNRVSSWIRVHHKTLADFLFNPSRSEPHGLYIDQDAVYNDIRNSVCSVFLRQIHPEREGYAAFLNYLEAVDTSPDRESPPPSNSSSPASTMSQMATVSGQLKWSPWAVRLHYDFSSLSILQGLGQPRFDFKQVCMNDKSMDPSISLSAYDGSAAGRLCLLLAPSSADQPYYERSQTPFQALVRHAIRSQNDLLKSDEAIGWNLVNSNNNDLHRANIYFENQPKSYISNVCTQVVDDLKDPDWVNSRLGMLLSWHEGGHRTTDDPWEHAARGILVEVTSDTQLLCLSCRTVLKLCMAEVIMRVLAPLRPEARLYSELFELVSAYPVLWNHSELFYLWSSAIERYNALIASDTQLASVAAKVQEQRKRLVRSREERIGELVQDGWDEESAFYMAYRPYSRACLPLLPSDAHAVRVSKRRAAWYLGIELPDVVYTYPGIP